MPGSVGGGVGVGEAGGVRAPGELVGVAGADLGAGSRRAGRSWSLGDDAAVADDDQVVGDDFDLVQQVGGQQHGGAAVGVAAQQVAHPADAGGVQTVGGLVEDEDLGVAEERVGDAEALPHAQGVVAGPAGRLRRR